MIFEVIAALLILANIIGWFLLILSPLVVPIGTVMIQVVDALLEYFPFGNLILYIVLFIIFVAAGIIANTSLFGDKLMAKFNKFDEKHFKKYTKHIPENADDAFKTIGEKKKKPKSEEESKKDVKKDSSEKILKKDSSKKDSKEDNSKKDSKEDNSKKNVKKNSSKKDIKENDTKDDKDAKKDDIIQKDIKKEENDTD